MAEPRMLGRYQQGADEDVPVSSARLEPSTLPWPGDKEIRKEGAKLGLTRQKCRAGEGIGSQAEGGKGSAESMSSSRRGPGSRTESELGGRGSRMEGRWAEVEKAKEAEANGKGPLDHFMIEERDSANWMPEKAAQVFSPNVTILRPSMKYKDAAESAAFRAGEIEKNPLLSPQGTPPDAYYDWSTNSNTPPIIIFAEFSCSCFDRDVLKLGAFVLAAAVSFPFLVWGAYAFLPFDAPLLSTAPLRLIYTLRCSVFATVPIVLGVLVLGVSRLRFSSSEASLAIMATYVSQDLLKLVPLLTVVFAFGRLVYWVSVALGSPVRGLGFGLSFLPILPMLGANLYFIFTLEGGGGLLAVEPRPHPRPPA
ncbi:hypothetical protein ANANG_G00181420 [Anguilla anguilla]|uniref:Uncharacterized protein n=1 Tax=Anguilla anguilla TaxID=7936 RepID=A0A9D3M8L9_ANGAN|nr:hypothetical protein ANANG_G00181420 [Anguilla anguilla]